MASASVPKMVIRQIKRLMCNVLRSVHGDNRSHWVRWSEVCSPIREGGLGIHSIYHVMESLHAKLMCTTMSGDLPWAKFARAKYLKGGAMGAYNQVSPLWGTLSYAMQIGALDNWQGYSRFWMDNWLREPIYRPQPVDATLTIVEGLKMISEMWHLIPMQFHAEILKISTSNNLEDQLIFTATNNGKFSTRKYANLTNTRGMDRHWADWIWHTFLPPNISVFLWKLVRQALPVHCQIQAKGINLVSRCRCCLNPAKESIIYLFIQLDVATTVWKHFGNIFRVPYVFGSVIQALSIWMEGWFAWSQYGICRIGVAAHIFPVVWVARCRATYDESPMNAMLEL